MTLGNQRLCPDSTSHTQDHTSGSKTEPVCLEGSGSLLCTLASSANRDLLGCLQTHGNSDCIAQPQAMSSLDSKGMVPTPRPRRQSCAMLQPCPTSTTCTFCKGSLTAGEFNHCESRSWTHPSAPTPTTRTYLAKARPPSPQRKPTGLGAGPDLPVPTSLRSLSLPWEVTMEYPGESCLASS